MKYLIIFILLFSSCTKKQELINQEKSEIKTTIKENISFVKAKVIEKNKTSDFNYSLKLLILESRSDENLPNLAVQNDTIKAFPVFIVDETGNININDERNKNLLRLSYVRIGEEVDLNLTYNLNKGWQILNFNKKY